MDCDTKIRLKDLVVEAARALDENDGEQTSLEKRQFLWAAEINLFKHEDACEICCPLVQEISVSQYLERWAVIADL
jgi:hypothetical protein